MNIGKFHLLRKKNTETMVTTPSKEVVTQENDNFSLQSEEKKSPINAAAFGILLNTCVCAGQTETEKKEPTKED